MLIRKKRALVAACLVLGGVLWYIVTPKYAADFPVADEECVRNLRALHQAVIEYARDHHGRLPVSNLNDANAYSWVALLRPYIARYEPDPNTVLYCPKDKQYAYPSSYLMDMVGFDRLSSVPSEGDRILFCENLPRHQGRQLAITANRMPCFVDAHHRVSER